MPSGNPRRNGDVILEPGKITQPIEVKGEYSNIIFSWPLGEKYPLEARTKGGNIKWRLSEEPSFEESNGFSLIRVFLQEKDKPSVSLSTSYGNIRIEELR